MHKSPLSLRDHRRESLLNSAVQDLSQAFVDAPDESYGPQFFDRLCTRLLRNEGGKGSSEILRKLASWVKFSAENP